MATPFRGRPLGRSLLIGSAFLWLGLAFWQAEAAPPQIAKIAGATLQPGATSTLLIDGTDLLPDSRVLLPVPIVRQSVKPGKGTNQLQIEVKLPDNIPLGVYQLRLANDKGISNPIGVEIDDFPQQPFGPHVAKLPVALQGNLAGSATLQTTFAGKKGENLVLEVEARRLGSAINPVIRLFDAKRLQLASAQGSNVLGGDARLSVVLPADGPYTVELHDNQYKAGTPNRFRLKIGDYRYADFALPLAAQRSTKAAFQLIGHVPDKTRVEADLTNVLGHLPFLPRVAGLRGAMPRILVSDWPELVEVEPAPSKPQEIPVPGGISGRLHRAKETDRYRLPVLAGTKLRFEVHAERLGSPLDGVLTITNEAGMQLAQSDDQANTTDPGLEFTVPNGVNAIVAAITDLHGRGGQDFVYRLTVVPVPWPDFSLAVSEDRLLVPRGAAALVRVRASRSGYDGPIKLHLPGLPEGVTVRGAEIPAGTTETLLSVTAPESAKLAQVVTMIVGEGSEAGRRIQQLALPPETPLTKAQPWLRSELGFAVTEPGPLAVHWDLPEGNLPIGSTVIAKVRVSRNETAKGALRLSLVTSQVVPKGKNNQDDLNRAIRLEGTPTLTGEQKETDVKILVPADLPPLPYDLAVRADLLGADNKTILMSAFSSGRRLIAAKDPGAKKE